MSKKNNTLKSITPFIIIAGLGVAGYFIWKHFKEEPPTPPPEEISAKINSFTITST